MSEFEHDALVIRTCGPNGESHGGFRWSMTVGDIVECPDWDPTPECGGGLHGLLDGLGNWGLIDTTPGRVWQVLGVRREECVEIDADKVKFPRARILHSGDVTGAMALIQPAMHERIRATVAEAVKDASTTTARGKGEHASAAGYRGHASAAGDGGHASAAGDWGHASAAGDGGHASAAGYRGHASAAGYRGHASAAGDWGHASAAGYRGHASAAGDGGHASAAGDGGHASAAGDWGHASAAGSEGHASAAGKHGIAAALGPNSTAQAGDDGWIVLTQWRHGDGGWELVQVRTAKVGGPEGIKAGVAYRLNEGGEFEEAAS